MTTASIVKAINALPTEERMKIVEQVIHTIRMERQKKPKRKENSDNPSPSGDTWFDDPRNIAGVKEAIQSAKDEQGIVLASKEDINEYFANL